MAQNEFSRNYNREGMSARGSNGQRLEWWSAQFGALLNMHVFKEPEASYWVVRLVGTVSKDYNGYATRDDAMRAAFALAKAMTVDLTAALDRAANSMDAAPAQPGGQS